MICTLQFFTKKPDHLPWQQVDKWLSGIAFMNHLLFFRWWCQLKSELLVHLQDIGNDNLLDCFPFFYSTD